MTLAKVISSACQILNLRTEGGEESMESKRMPEVGEAVVFVDPVGVAHSALVTAAWSEDCINVVFVSGDLDKRDSYGRQIERQTSIMHAAIVPVHGNYWRFVDEPGKETERAA